MPRVYDNSPIELDANWLKLEGNNMWRIQDFTFEIYNQDVHGETIWTAK